MLPGEFPGHRLRVMGAITTRLLLSAFPNFHGENRMSRMIKSLPFVNKAVNMMSFRSRKV